MSDLLYFEAPNQDGSLYQVGDWKRYAVHNETQIKGFFGKYRFLSNFYPCEVWFEGIKYKSTETAYQSAKILPHARQSFVHMSDTDSKNAWKQFSLKDRTPNWENIKYDIMREVIFQKFLRNKELRNKLISTRNKYLEELNHWHDEYYGVCIHTNTGENNLGIILMNTRNYFDKS